MRIKFVDIFYFDDVFEEYIVNHVISRENKAVAFLVVMVLFEWYSFCL